MPSNHDVTTCDSCGQRIRWTITAEHGRKQAVNADPDPRGNRAVHTTIAFTVVSRALTKDRPTLEGSEWQAMPHVATCTAPVRRTAARPGRRRPVVTSWRRQ